AGISISPGPVEKEMEEKAKRFFEKKRRLPRHMAIFAFLLNLANARGDPHRRRMNGLTMPVAVIRMPAVRGNIRRHNFGIFDLSVRMIFVAALSDQSMNGLPHIRPLAFVKGAVEFHGSRPKVFNQFAALDPLAFELFRINFQLISAGSAARRSRIARTSSG